MNTAVTGPNGRMTGGAAKFQKHFAPRTFLSRQGPEFFFENLASDSTGSLWKYGTDQCWNPINRTLERGLPSWLPFEFYKTTNSWEA
jgi:hypothetical protein